MEKPRYITLKDAAKLTPGRPALSTIWRWARRGTLTRTGQRVRLAHVRIGKRVYTTAADLEAFFHAVANADAPYFEKQTASTKAHRTKAHARAESKLREKGVL